MSAPNILGVRERTDKLVRELVLDDAAPFVPLVKTKRRRPGRDRLPIQFRHCRGHADPRNQSAIHESH